MPYDINLAYRINFIVNVRGTQYNSLRRSTIFNKNFPHGVQLVSGERMNKLNSIVISLFRRWRGYARTEATEFELIVASVFMSGFVIQSGALMYHLQVSTF